MTGGVEYLNLLGKMNDIVKAPGGHLGGGINQSQLCHCETQDIDQDEKYRFRCHWYQYIVVVRVEEGVTLLRKSKHCRQDKER